MAWWAASSSWTTWASAWARFKRGAGGLILRSAPYLMKFLSIAGTAAMFLVGGGILVHGVPALHHVADAAKAIPPGWLWQNLFNALAGVLAGAVLVAATMLLRRLRGKPATPVH